MRTVALERQVVSATDGEQRKKKKKEKRKRNRKKEEKREKRKKKKKVRLEAAIRTTRASSSLKTIRHTSLRSSFALNFLFPLFLNKNTYPIKN